MLTSLSFFLFFTMSLFFIGFFGIALNRRNVLLVLLCIEIMLLAVNLNFIIYSTFLDDFFGQLFALYVLSVAAAESAIGLALLVVYYRVQGNLSINSVNLLHGLLINTNINAFFIFN
jgi:NADH-quinone oxidoreductase subunit K